MDALLTAAARALATGDVLAALDKVALRVDPPALALRGIAMAQLGELERARLLLRQAHRTFGREEAVARARCVVADAEIALALRELSGSTAGLEAAADLLDARHDTANALQAWLIVARRAIVLGQWDAATRALARLQDRALPPALVATAHLTAAALALRTLRLEQADAALRTATMAACQAGIAALRTEVALARAALEQPAARQLLPQGDTLLDLHGVRALRNAPGCVVVDACRHDVWSNGHGRSLARRPLLFTLLQQLGRAWPGDIDRDVLIASVFRAPHGDDTHRARLRVEVGRLRGLLKGWLAIEATPDGYRLRPPEGTRVVVLAPPIDGEAGAVAALLADGAAWSSSALALALGTSQRGVQRALADLEQAGKVRAQGRGRAQRWRAPPFTGFTTILLLPPLLPGD